MTRKKWLKHIRGEGLRSHVLWWDTRGEHCTEKNCEINQPKSKKRR